MPLSAPVPRKASHIRRVTYQGYEREDGLWDMEAELHDSKAHDMPSFRHQGVRLAGDPIHHMWLRVTIDRQLVVHAIEAAMDLDVGPLIRQSQQQRVWDFLSDAQVAGIPMVAQGVVVDEAPEGGFYQAPTLLRDVPVGHRLAQEEVFGPVLSAMAFQDEDHAVELANATQFGLVAGIWTRDGARQFRMAKRVHSGQVFINNYGAGGGVELPFGGVKSSGYGREKGFEALYGFTTLKTVAIKHG